VIKPLRDSHAAGRAVRRRPWIVAVGLRHGLGFADAQVEVGLPPLPIPMTLLFFNVGVEFGQLNFIAVRRGAGERQALKPLRRYITRPPLAYIQLRCDATGQVALKRKAPGAMEPRTS
jgi:hypothetical protein